MPDHPPTRTKLRSLWEGGTRPPLRLRDEKPSVLQLSPSSPSLRPRARASNQSGPGLKRQAFVLVCVLIFSIPAYFLASRFVITAVVIQGRSMSPTLRDGEHYYLNRWRYLFLPPQRGDVVVIKDPGHNDYAVKRIVGRPYDWLNLREGKIFVNGKRLHEPYLDKGVRTDSPDMKEKWVQLGPDQYYVLGDNRANSEDSRYYGVVLRQNILGQIVK